MKNVILFAVLSSIFISCSKYEEGGASLATKKSRLVNHWKTVKLSIDGQDVTSTNTITELDIRDDNTITFQGQQGGYWPVLNGDWEFDSDKSNMKVSYGNDPINYEIIKLKKNELKLRRTYPSGEVYEYEFETYN